MQVVTGNNDDLIDSLENILGRVNNRESFPSWKFCRVAIYGSTFKCQLRIYIYLYHFAWADKREKQGYKSDVSLKRGYK